MHYIKGSHRTQAVLFPTCLDDVIGQDNDVRIIDLFVDSINLSDFKFIVRNSTEVGQPMTPRIF